MNKDMLENFTMWGDRSSRDTAHLMDLVAAGVIDQTIGHGTVTLRPARLEEIVSRIAHRTQDPDGGWVVTLMPDSTHERSPTPEEVLAYVAEIEPHIGSRMPGGIDPDDIIGLIVEAGKPGVTLRDLGMQGYASFVQWVDERV